MRLIFSVLSFCIALVTPAAAQQIGQRDGLLARVSPVVFCVDPYPEQDPDNPEAAIWIFPSARVAAVSDSTRVPASLGTAFGLEVLAAGPDRLHDVTVLIEHPQLPDGKTRHEWIADYPSTRFGYSFYGFGFPDELVTGEWTFSLIHEDRVLYRYMFTVAAPEAATPDYRFCE